MGTEARFWLRWSLRDLRRRWLLVAAIAMVLAIGTGMFAALGSTATWRRDSNDASFAAVDFHDLRVELAAGETVGAGQLLDVLGALSAPDVVAAAEERLRLPTQIEAAGSEGSILVRGEIVGIDVSDGPPEVDRLHVTDGIGLDEGGAGLVETRFAQEYGLAVDGELSVAGGQSVPYSGFGVGPEEFVLIGDDAGLLGYRNWAVVYLPLAEAGRVSGVGDRVNDLVVRLSPGADVDAVAEELESVIATDLGLGADIGGRRDSYSYRTLYDDVDNDEKVWNVMAGLILVGAAFASFNLVSRVVEAQRREIGVGMALGVPPTRLAIRPIMVGVQVGVLGAVAGLGVGFAMGVAMQSLLESLVPLPVWVFDFDWGQYLRAGALGLALPIAAAALPVWWALRVEPVDAITTVHTRARSGLLGRVGRRLRVPGHSLAQVPLRNLLRRPRRAIFTALAVGATITTLVAVLGLLDSLFTTLQRVEDEALQGEPDRLDVSLEGFVTDDDPLVSRVAGTAGVVAASTALQLPAAAIADDASVVTLLVRFVDFADGVWVPTIVDGADASGSTGGIVLSHKAAKDLGVSVGDDVMLRHPDLSGALGVTMSTTSVTVSGLHPDPIRAYAYADVSDSGLFGADGLRNMVMLIPADEAAAAAIPRAVFGIEGVVSTTSVRAVNEAIGEAIGEFTGFLRILEGGVLALALLIAYNASSISTEERAREHATMFAFGVRVRTVTLINMAESAAVGLLGTVVGLAVGYGVVWWMVEVLFDDTFPELGLVVDLAPATIAVSLGLGVVVVAVAPVLAVRRLVRMEIADTLRVME